MAEKETGFDVLIVGAGISGLTAALHLANAGIHCVVLEASHRAGGRIVTEHTTFDQPIELGAEFIHGDLLRTKELLQKAEIPLRATGGGAYRKREDAWVAADPLDNYEALQKKFSSLSNDETVETFLREHFAAPADAPSREALRSYTEGYNAADPATASTFALREDLAGSADSQYRPTGGYETLVHYLQQQLATAGVPVFFSSPVSAVAWKPGRITATTHAGQQWGAKACLVTVSLGVLQGNGLTFSPLIPQQQAAWNSLGFGHVLKVVLQFRTAFWLDEKQVGTPVQAATGFLFSSEEIPTWWTQLPADVPLLTGWSGGPDAQKLQHLNKDEVEAAALRSLSRLFGISPASLEKELVTCYYKNWSKDPFVRGAYSFKTVGDAVHKKLLKTGVDKTLFFAGEALCEGGAAGTVEAALDSGSELAQTMGIALKGMV